MAINYIPSQEDYKELKPFKRFALQNFPFIDANFDALTNYELMAKIIEYLNNVIANENAVESNVSGLYNAFVSLHNFTNNYFDNLDVQDEINNKLDEMAQDGTLTQLIKGYVDPIIAELNEEFDVVKDEVASVVSGSPAGVYPTISALQSADPDHTRIYLVEADGEWYFFNNTTNQWKNGGVYQATSVSNNDPIIQKINGRVNALENSLVSSTTLEPWQMYERYTYGVTSSTNVGGVVSPVSSQSWDCYGYIVNEGDDIEVETTTYGETYYCVSFGYVSGSNIILVEKNDVGTGSGVSNRIKKTYTVPAGATRLLVNCRKPDTASAKIVVSKIDKINERIKEIPNVITVKKDGSGDFTKISDAVNSITDASIDNKYKIEVYTGTYDLLSEMGGNNFLASITTTARQGLKIPAYTEIIGIGDVVINFLPSDEYSNLTTTTALSPFEVYGEFKLENITINAKNCRYCIHDETNNNSIYENQKHIYKNVILNHQENKSGTWISSASFGCGTGGGCSYEFIDCTFKGYNFYGFAMHNNTNQNSCRMSFDGCDITGYYKPGNLTKDYSMQFNYLGTNTKPFDVWLKNIISEKPIICKGNSASGNDNVYVFHNTTNIELDII